MKSYLKTTAGVVLSATMATASYGATVNVGELQGFTGPLESMIGAMSGGANLAVTEANASGAEEEKALQAKAEEVVDFLSISHLKNERAGNLSGGQKKLLELARTMMVDAKVVLLDEVGAGVNRTLLKQIGDAIVRLNEERGYTFCMIEHDMDFISRLCDPVVVLAEGQILTSGTPDEIKSSDAVIEAYLGKGIKTEAAN